MSRAKRHHHYGALKRRVILLGMVLPLLAVLPALAGAVPAQAAAAPAADQTLMNVGTGQCLGAHYNSTSGAMDMSTNVQYCSGLDGDAWRLIAVDQSGDCRHRFQDDIGAAEQRHRAVFASGPGGTAAPVTIIGCVPLGGDDVWHLVSTDHFGDWQLVDTYTGWCLDSDYNGSIATRACNGGGFQTWQVTPGASNGSAPMVLKDVATGLCLGTGSTGAYTQSCNGSSSQNWGQSSSPWDSPSFNLQNKNAPGKCVGTDAYPG